MEPETGVSFSGGGFSRYFAQPSYQTGAVSAYIKYLDGRYDGLYKCDLCYPPFREPPLNSGYYICSANGRGFPDVAARGSWYQVVVGGGVTLLGGTSASSPVRDPLDPSVR